MLVEGTGQRREKKGGKKKCPNRKMDKSRSQRPG
jgi:hypothetical protein